MPSSVSAVPAASGDRAAAHFGSAFEFETDCAEGFQNVEVARIDVFRFDRRGLDWYGAVHLSGAVNMPDRKIVDSKTRDYPEDTLFVVYCAGPHCNGAHRAAWRLAKLGRPVKLMIGGVTGWIDEGFALARLEAA